MRRISDATVSATCPWRPELVDLAAEVAIQMQRGKVGEMLRTMRQQTSALSQRRVGYDVRKLDPRITTALCDDIERLQFANAAASGDWAGEPLAAMAAISAFVSKASEAVDQAHSGLHTLVQRMTSCLRQSCQVANARYICMGCATRYCSLRCQRLVRTHSRATDVAVTRRTEPIIGTGAEVSAGPGRAWRALSSPRR